MKTFRRIVSEVAQPSSEDELNFKEKHVIDHILDPNSEEDQFTADGVRKFYNRADYKRGEDMAVYEGVTLTRRDLLGQEDGDVNNDGVKNAVDAQLMYRRHAQIKNKIIDEESRADSDWEKDCAKVKKSKDPKFISKMIEKWGSRGSAWLNHPALTKTTDPVGQEDDDINNDGKVDKSDAYLRARRKAIARKLQQEGLMDVIEPVGGEYGDEEKSHVAYKKKNMSNPDHRGEPVDVKESLTDVIEPVGGEYGDEEKSHVAYKKKNMSNPDHRGEPVDVKESRLDEVSRDLATRAAHAFSNRADKAHAKKDYAGYKKGEAARKMAVNKVTGHAKVPAVPRNVPLPKAVEEEVEQIHEVSKQTLKSYVKKAEKSYDSELNKAAKAGREMDRARKTNPGDADVHAMYRNQFLKHAGKSEKRLRGLIKADEKLAKECIEEGAMTTGPVRGEKPWKPSATRPEGEWDPIHGKAPKKGTLKYQIWKEKVRQDKGLANEDVSLANPKAGMRVYAGKTKKSQIAEAFEEGAFYFDDGSTAALFREEAEVLNNLFESLDESNREKMVAIATSCEAGLKDIVRFAKEVL